MNREFLSLYKKYTPDGAPSQFYKNQLVLHEDQVYKFIHPASNLKWENIPEPGKNSLFWVKENIPPVFFKGESSPQGLKVLGDKWQNSKTNRTYTWIKSGTKYVWSS